MTNPRPISEDDLHAYIDHALEPARRAEVEAFLDANPDAAQRVQGFIRQRDDLRAAFGPIAEEPVPPHLALPALMKARRPTAAPNLRAAAAAVLLLAIGAGAGWFGRGTMRPTPVAGVAAVAQEALVSFDTYATDMARPVEIRAVDRTDLLKWLSKRLGRPIAAPDLASSGYHFMGGRLVATPHGPAGLFMYDNDAGLRIVMLVRPMAIEKNAPMLEHAEGRVAGFAWAQNGLGYGLVGATPAKLLHPLADEARRQTAAGA